MPVTRGTAQALYSLSSAGNDQGPRNRLGAALQAVPVRTCREAAKLDAHGGFACGKSALREQSPHEAPLDVVEGYAGDEWSG